MLFENLIKEWLAKGLNRHGMRTQSDYLKIVKRHFLEFYPIELKDLNEKVLLKYMIKLSEGRQLKTLKNIKSCLSSFFDWCLCNDYIDVNPCASHTLTVRLKSYCRTSKDKVKKRKHAITPEQAIMLLNRCYRISSEFGLATEMLLCTGLRLGEIAALTWCDIGTRVDVNKKVVIEEPGKPVENTAKWGSNGCVEIPKELQIKLKFYRKSDSSLNSVFPYLRRKANAYSKRLGRLSDKLGIPHTTAHTLRRTALTWLAADGHSLSIIQRIARHTTMRMTEQYIDSAHMPITGITESLSRKINPPATRHIVNL